MIGDSLARLERYTRGRAISAEEVRLYPQHVRARAGLAMLYQSTGREAPKPNARWPISCATSPRGSAPDTAASVWRMFGRPDRAAAVEAESRRRSR